MPPGSRAVCPVGAILEIALMDIRTYAALPFVIAFTVAFIIPVDAELDALPVLLEELGVIVTRFAGIRALALALTLAFVLVRLIARRLVGAIMGNPGLVTNRRPRGWAITIRVNRLVRGFSELELVVDPVKLVLVGVQPCIANALLAFPQAPHEPVPQGGKLRHEHVEGHSAALRRVDQEPNE